MGPSEKIMEETRQISRENMRTITPTNKKYPYRPYYLKTVLNSSVLYMEVMSKRKTIRMFLRQFHEIYEQRYIEKSPYNRVK